MRSLRHVKGVNTFAFPDSVWKVKGWKTRKRGTRAQKGKKYPIVQRPRKVTRVASIVEQQQERAREKRLEKPKKKEIVKPPIVKKVRCECGKWFLPSEIVRHSYECDKFSERWGKDTPVTKPKPKAKRIKKPKKRKIKPPKPRQKLTHVERMHLLAACKQFGIDPQEVDNKIDYYENKKHVQTLAKMKGYSEQEISSMEQEQREWASQYQGYLNNLKSELESAGYEVSSPEL